MKGPTFFNKKSPIQANYGAPLKDHEKDADGKVIKHKVEQTEQVYIKGKGKSENTALTHEDHETKKIVATKKDSNIAAILEKMMRGDILTDADKAAIAADNKKKADAKVKEK